MSNKFYETPEFQKLWALAHSKDRNVRVESAHYLAKALEIPLRKAILSGDVTQNIFKVRQTNGEHFTMPLSILPPGKEGDYVAYSIPTHGYIPQRRVEAQEVMIPTFHVANSIDWLLTHAKNAGSWFIQEAMEIYEAGFTIKINNDAWALLLGTAYDRNVVVYDADATAGQFTKRLLSLTQTQMRRGGGGNSGSIRRSRLTDVYLSPEGVEDIRNWNVDQIPESIRTQIYLANDNSGALMNIYGVQLHDMDEFGVGQAYQNYYLNSLGGTLAAGDTELAVGLDLSRGGSFVMPMREQPQNFDDPILHREQKAGIYGWGEWGFGALDSRDVILLSY